MGNGIALQCLPAHDRERTQHTRDRTQRGKAQRDRANTV